MWHSNDGPKLLPVILSLPIQSGHRQYCQDIPNMLDKCITAVQGMSSECGLLLEWTSVGANLIPESVICKLNAGLLFQYPGLLIAALAGAGVAKFLRNPAPWLKGLLAGYIHNLAISVGG